MAPYVKTQPGSQSEGDYSQSADTAQFQNFPIVQPPVLREYLEKIGTTRANHVFKMFQQEIREANQLDRSKGQTTFDLKKVNDELAAARKAMPELEAKAKALRAEISHLKGMVERFDERNRHNMLERIDLREDVQAARNACPSYAQYARDKKKATADIADYQQDLANQEARVARIETRLSVLGGDPESSREQLKSAGNEANRLSNAYQRLVIATQENSHQQNKNAWIAYEKSTNEEIAKIQQEIGRCQEKYDECTKKHTNLSVRAKKTPMHQSSSKIDALIESKKQKTHAESALKRRKDALKEQQKQLDQCKLQLPVAIRNAEREAQQVDLARQASEQAQADYNMLATKVSSPAPEVVRLCADIKKEKAVLVEIRKSLEAARKRLDKAIADLEWVDDTRDEETKNKIKRIDTIAAVLSWANISPEQGEQLGIDMFALRKANNSLARTETEIADALRRLKENRSSSDSYVQKIDTTRTKINQIQERLRDLHKEAIEEVAKIRSKKPDTRPSTSQAPRSTGTFADEVSTQGYFVYRFKNLSELPTEFAAVVRANRGVDTSISFMAMNREFTLVKVGPGLSQKILRQNETPYIARSDVPEIHVVQTGWPSPLETPLPGFNNVYGAFFATPDFVPFASQRTKYATPADFSGVRNLPDPYDMPEVIGARQWDGIGPEAQELFHYHQDAQSVFIWAYPGFYLHDRSGGRDKRRLYEVVRSHQPVAYTISMRTPHIVILPGQPYYFVAEVNHDGHLPLYRTAKGLVFEAPRKQSGPGYNSSGGASNNGSGYKGGFRSTGGGNADYSAESGQSKQSRRTSSGRKTGASHDYPQDQYYGTPHHPYSMPTFTEEPAPLSPEDYVRTKTVALKLSSGPLNIATFLTKRRTTEDMKKEFGALLTPPAVKLALLKEMIKDIGDIYGRVGNQLAENTPFVTLFNEAIANTEKKSIPVAIAQLSPEMQRQWYLHIQGQADSYIRTAIYAKETDRLLVKYPGNSQSAKTARDEQIAQFSTDLAAYDYQKEKNAKKIISDEEQAAADKAEMNMSPEKRREEAEARKKEQLANQNRYEISRKRVAELDSMHKKMRAELIAQNGEQIIDAKTMAKLEKAHLDEFANQMTETFESNGHKYFKIYLEEKYQEVFQPDLAATLNGSSLARVNCHRFLGMLEEIVGTAR